MKIQYCSDLHLEFRNNWHWLKNNPILPTGEILLVGGDTHYLGADFKKHEWFDYVSANWEQVYLIPGNHEFYGGYGVEMCMEYDYELQIRHNVFLVNNTVREIGNLRLIFSTMWSRIEKEIVPILNGLNDFRLIHLNNKVLTLDGYNRLFDRAWEFLKKELYTKTEKHKIVMTHHLPSDECNLDIYKGSTLNEAFCIDLTQQILDSDISYWIFGHSHGNVPDFKIGNTTMLTNQLGYIDDGSEKFYKGDTYFEVD